MIKGIFKLRPSLPKYITTYDPNIMLRYIDSLPHDNFLLMKLLTKKVVHITAPAKWTTCAVLAGLKIIKIKPIKWHIPFYIDKILETTKPGKPQKPLEYREFNSSKKHCVILCLKEYISRTVLIREYLEGNKDQLILSYAYPHKPIIYQSISRYIKLALELSGIDATVFTAHWTRSSSTSKANHVEFLLKDIKKAAGWRGSSMFRKYYSLPLIKNFEEEILGDFNNNSCNWFVRKKHYIV